MHEVYGTLVHQNMKFYLYFAHFVCKFECIGELFFINEQNTNKTSYLGVEDALS
jgi:hypothetical protein